MITIAIKSVERKRNQSWDNVSENLKKIENSIEDYKKKLINVEVELEAKPLQNPSGVPIQENETKFEVPHSLNIKQIKTKKSKEKVEYKKKQKDLEIKRKKKESSRQSYLVESNETSIKNIAEGRNIKYLVHFTRLENLESIIEHGFISRKKLEGSVLNASFNDDMRLDNQPNTISTSVSFPNHKMFYKYKINSNSKWVVLKIKIDILYNQKAAFCMHNAADRKIRNKNINNLMDGSAFKSMFDDGNYQSSRVEQGLKSYDPTDPQAEILIFDSIPSKFIEGIYFDDKFNLSRFKVNYPCINAWHGKDNMFSTRDYARSR